MRASVIAAGLAAILLMAAGQTMTVREFLNRAEVIPRNPTAMLRADTRRLINEVTRSVEQLKSEQAAALRAGRRPAHCIPARGTGITAEALLARLEAVPTGRRGITVTQAIREWMAERHPCPA